MSVIGKLDDQVNAILITPLAQRNANEAEAPDIPALEKVAASDAQEGTAKTPEPALKKVQDESPLPVWLL